MKPSCQKCGKVLSANRCTLCFGCYLKKRKDTAAITKLHRTKCRRCQKRIRNKTGLCKPCAVGKAEPGYTARVRGGRVALRRCLWIALFVQRNRKVTFEDVGPKLGISLRSYRRYLRDLREAGMMLEGMTGGPQSYRERGTRFIAFDAELAPVIAS